MNGYTQKQLEYINSVDGNAHMSAVEIIGDLEARHSALLEAVEWERECGEMRFTDIWFDEWSRTESQAKKAMLELRATVDAARAEVDRLIAGEGAANCEGEG